MHLCRLMGTYLISGTVSTLVSGTSLGPGSRHLWTLELKGWQTWLYLSNKHRHLFGSRGHLGYSVTFIQITHRLNSYIPDPTI